MTLISAIGDPEESLEDQYNESPRTGSSFAPLPGVRYGNGGPWISLEIRRHSSAEARKAMPHKR
jgi:hypothetical protein